MALIVLSACASDGETDRWGLLMDGVSTNKALSDRSMSRTRVVKSDGRDLVNRFEPCSAALDAEVFIERGAMEALAISDE